MASIFNMYKDVASPDVTADIRESRRESEANTRKTQETAFAALKKSNIVTLQQQYRAGSGRFKDITDPDKKFQVYYDALKALDPQAAQDASKVYAEERQRRINREVADAYKKEGSTGNEELDKINQVIATLQSNIDIEKAQKEQAEIDAQKEQELNARIEESSFERFAQRVNKDQVKEGSLYFDPSIQTGRQLKPTPELEVIKESDWSKLGSVPTQEEIEAKASVQGYTPNISNFYSTDRKMPTFDISLSNEGVITPDMEGYRPLTIPTQQSLARLYRGR